MEMLLHYISQGLELALLVAAPIASMWLSWKYLDGGPLLRIVCGLILSAVALVAVSVLILIAGI